MRHFIQTAAKNIIVAAATLCIALPGPALAAAPIRFVSGYSPGGVADQITRLVASEVAPLLGATIVVESKVGAAGMIAATAVARAEPDGKTFLVGSNAPLVINSVIYSKMAYDPVKDFVPVAAFSKSPLMVSVRKDLPVTSMAQLTALAKQEPGKLAMGSAGSGNITHLGGEYVAKTLGFSVTHVPFPGCAPAIVNALGGNVDLLFCDMTSSLQQAKAGNIRALAILDDKRFPMLPDVPTMKELGHPGLESGAWFGLMAPAKTPADVVIRLNEAVNTALKRPEVIEKLRAIGAQPMPGSPEDFNRFIMAERERWHPVAKSVGIKVD